MRRVVLTIAASAFLFSGTPLDAVSRVEIAIQNGRLFLTASNATIPEIFEAWARIGQTIIVNGDKVTGPPLTIQLLGVPEEQALEVLLRNASGYLAVNRQMASTDRSHFERIVILPTSSGTRTAVMPALPASTPPPPSAMDLNGVVRLLGPDGQPVEDDQAAAPPPPQPATAAVPAPGSPVPGMVAPAPAPQPPPGTYTPQR
jgi:hypothetical protein